MPMIEQPCPTPVRAQLVVNPLVSYRVSEPQEWLTLPLFCIDRKRIYKAFAFEPTEEELDAIQNSIQRKPEPFPMDSDDDDFSPSGSKNKGKGKAVDTSKDKAEDIFEGLDIEQDHWEPSTKMLKMVCFCITISEKLPHQLIPIFS